MLCTKSWVRDLLVLWCKLPANGHDYLALILHDRECLTDNINRTIRTIRSILAQHGYVLLLILVMFVLT